MPNKYSNRRRSPRYQMNLRARLLFSVVLSKGEETGARDSGKLHLVGHTKDISEFGLALVVPIAAIDERYLAGANNTLEIELYLPSGSIKIEARAVHFKPLDESLEESIFTEGYLIGAEITRVSHRPRFLEFLRTLEEDSP
jgi:hypothetical protein